MRTLNSQYTTVDSQGYIIKKSNDKCAIFDASGKQISRWWKEISISGLIKGKSDYYIATNDHYLSAIFHKDNPDQPISQWWNDIYSHGLVQGQSEYYIAKNNQGLEAIFHVGNPNEPISMWGYNIKAYGAVLGVSDYYILSDERHRQAIFHINNSHDPITQWWYWIRHDGLVSNESEYYIAETSNGTQAIFHISDNQFPISEWYQFISPTGIVHGTSYCYACRSSRESLIQVYSIEDMLHPLYEIPKSKTALMLHVNDLSAIMSLSYHIVMYNAETQRMHILGHMKDRNGINIAQTDLLISQFMHHDIFPVVHRDEFSLTTKVYLYNMTGNIPQTFDNIGSMKEYIQDHIIKNNTTDILRLY